MLPLMLLLVGAKCDGGRGGAGSSEADDIRRATLLATGDSLPVWPTKDAGTPVVLYVDRSRSMRGFLDPEYPSRVRTDFRSVLDGFAARLRPARVFGFGSGVRAVPDANLGVLGRAGFYADGNTEMEDVFANVEQDTVLGATHVIIGDGRRTNPDAGNGQFIRMREVVDRWVETGGTFILAASHAPFAPVEDDPSGCRGSGTDSAAVRETCPLYAFAFVAPGDQGRVAAALAASFEDLFVAPLPAVPATNVRLAAGSSGAISLEPQWTKDARGAPIARVRGPEQSNTPLHARIVLGDTASPRGRGMWAATRGRRLVPQLRSRRLVDDSSAVPWTRSGGRNGLMRPDTDPFGLDFITYGAAAPRHLYRLDLHPAGEPSWLDAYDARDVGDARRTYGLGRLFEGFRAADPLTLPPVLRLYAVVN